MISAGFDAHWRDPLANLRLQEDDFAWVTQKLMEVADTSAGGRMVSVLEGGYDLQGLALRRRPCHGADGGMRSRRTPARQDGHARELEYGQSDIQNNETPERELRLRDSGMAENTNADVKRLSFERAIEELETIVKRLEEGKVPLEESVAIYERGEALKRRCEQLLRQAEARVEKITTDGAGKVTGTEPLDVQ